MSTCKEEQILLQEENPYLKDFVFQETTGPGCSKLTTPLVNVLLKFQRLISNTPVFFVEKMWQKLLSFFQQKIQCI